MDSMIKEVHKTESLLALQKLIAIPSVNTSDGMTNPPFGKAIEDCLTEALVICEELGMTTYHDPAGFYGYADYGQGEELVGILCHLDVVPEGNLTLWKTNPFEGVVKDGVIYGRGSQDDKGPTIAALYAFKAVVDAELTFNKRIRFIFGTDEETLWRCMDQYNLNEEAPTMGFVPDGVFPLTYAEKGLLQAKLIGPGSNNLALHCGEASNVVPGKASYTGQDANEIAETLKELGIDYVLANQMITVNGKAVHASTAELGINAINKLAQGLAAHYTHPVINFLAEKVANETNGFSICGEVKDALTGELTFNVGSVHIDEASSEIVLDLRIPVKYTIEGIASLVEKTANEYKLVYEEYDAVPSLYIPKESPLVQTLMAIYRDKTGDLSEPTTSGGATYARKMTNMVAFGAHFPYTKSLAHQENEGMKLEELYLAMDIYAETIVQLCCK
ncbi:MAG: succinyl-diaminopimelate desuccinylase [Carnobacterium sp.]|uniref:M20 family metallopeptidase n=1 Tax=Carnobacterium sp. TaxID=48221 RepID=UPI00264791D4|nr:M20 family metallopeptidase [Carnobacterium sp.]MDN5373068.1 succinyl-diaminopimelate desuccinylase [Carnobacterium sp.]